MYPVSWLLKRQNNKLIKFATRLLEFEIGYRFGCTCDDCKQIGCPDEFERPRFENE
jgi:hypothetical protein